MSTQIPYNDLPRSDRNLIDDFQKLLDQVSQIRRGQYARKPGCSCDEKGLCAHHAAVDHRLVAVADDLAKAIQEAGRE